MQIGQRRVARCRSRRWRWRRRATPVLRGSVSPVSGRPSTSVSVTSSVMALAGRPLSRSGSFTRSTSLPSSSSRPDTLMATFEIEARPSPLGHGCARFGQHEVADLVDHAHLLGDGDELVGGDRAVFGVMPPRQRLHLDDLAAPDIGDRLIHHAQLRLRLECLGEQAAVSISLRRMLWSCSTE